MQDFNSRSLRILIIKDDNSHFIVPLLRSFSDHRQIRTDVLLCSKKNYFRYSRYLGKIVTVDSLNEDNIEDVLRETVNRLGSDLIIPTSEWMSILLFRHASKLEKFVKIHQVPDEETLEITGNKRNLNHWLRNNGYPATLITETVESWPGGFPLLLKPVSGSGGKGIRLINDSAELQSVINVGNHNGEEFILQEFIDGFDIDISFFAVNGKILFHTIQRGLISAPLEYAKGIEFIYDQELYKVASDMVRKLYYTGIAHLDFRYSSQKEEYILIDFNSRYWTTLQGSRAMGVNFPLLVVKYAITGKVDEVTYKTGYFYFTATALKTIFKNLFSHSKYPVRLKTTQLYFGYKDPLPELMQLIRQIQDSIMRKKRRR